jgi:hypothetical protein
LADALDQMVLISVDSLKAWTCQDLDRISYTGHVHLKYVTSWNLLCAHLKRFIAARLLEIVPMLC